MNSEQQLVLDRWLRMVTKRRRLIANIFIASIVVAVAASLLLPKVYRAEATWRLPQAKDVISAKELIGMMGDLSPEKIPILFPKQGEFIRYVELRELKGSSDKFRVIMDSKRIEAFEDASAELMFYLNQNPLLDRSVQQSRELLQKKIDELEIVIKQSTEMRGTFDKLLRDGRLTPVGFNPVELNKRVADLHVEKLSIEQALSNLSGVEAADKLVVLKKPVRPRPVLYVVLAGVMGLVIGVALAGVLEFINGTQRRSGE